MARQHLYSRVPAKNSMFAKTDGYDTFACSEGISREFIEKELAPVYDNKPTKNEADLIRNGMLPPVYFQTFCKTGEVVQSCMSFIPKDYTGERSSYLVHSLIFGENEKKDVFSAPDGNLISPEMFIDDISKIGTDAWESFPDEHYPEKEYVPSKSLTALVLTEEYDAKMIKYMICAVIELLFGKAKAVFPVLSVKREELSRKAVEFINTFAQILPYHIRPMLSFVTDSGEITKFSSFKIRFMPEDAPVVSGKGIWILFGKKSVVGISEEMYSSDAVLVEFFYSLLKSESLRREFLMFTDGVVTKDPSISSLNYKNISNLVFMFKQCSGMYNDKSVLPNDDRVFDFVAVYEKYRAALTDEQRVNALGFLKRYPEKHIEIPKKVFSKIAHFYPGEPEITKHIIMNVVLDMIHTDIMRDRLFAFIKSVYHDEDEETRKNLVRHLASVYYGGFLQPQILSFFSENFENEPEESKSVIIEKLLLTVRTPSVQQQIMSFFVSSYDMLSMEQKKKFYDTFLDMLPESDSLAEKMMDFVNERISGEPEEIVESVAKGICVAVEKDQRRKEPKLMSVMLTKRGFCTESVLKVLFSEWCGRKIFYEQIDIVWQYKLHDRIDYLIYVWKTVKDISDEAVDALLDKVKSAFDEENKKFDLFELISEEEIIDKSDKELSRKAKSFFRKIKEYCIKPRIIQSTYDVFSIKHRSHGIEDYLAYSEKNSEIKESEQYGVVLSYANLSDAVKNRRADEIVGYSDKFPEDPRVRSNIAQCIQNDIGEVVNPDDNAATSVALSFAFAGFISTGAYSFSAAYDRISSSFTSDAKNADRADFDNDRRALIAVIRAADIVCKKTDSADDICSEKSEIGKIITRFIGKHAKRGQKWLLSSIDLSPIDKRLLSFCSAAAKGAPVQNVGFFRKLFKK